jgi:hypothetical protein
MSVHKTKCLSISENFEIIRELERGKKNAEVFKKLIYRHLQFQLYGKTKKRFYVH